MKANCVVCGREFEKQGRGLACGRDCAKVHRRGYERERARRRRATTPTEVQKRRQVVYTAAYRQRIRERAAEDPEFAQGVEHRRKDNEARANVKKRLRYASDPDYRARILERQKGRDKAQKSVVAKRSYYKRKTEDPEWWAGRKAAHNQQRRERRAVDPEYRQAINQALRDYYHEHPEFQAMVLAYAAKRSKDPAVRARARARLRERLENEPGFRERCKERWRDWNRKRYAIDAEYRERERTKHRSCRHRQRLAAFFVEFQVLREKLQSHVQRIADSEQG